MGGKRLFFSAKQKLGFTGPIPCWTLTLHSISVFHMSNPTAFKTSFRLLEFTFSSFFLNNYK